MAKGLNYLKLLLFLILFVLVKIGQIARISFSLPVFSVPIRFKILAATVLIFAFFYTLLVAKLTAELPSPKQLMATERPLTTQILDRKGRLLYQIYEGRNRQLVKLEDLPSHLTQATLAIEDKHFFNHPGIDPGGMIRALKLNLKGQVPDGARQGGSTITQQLVKNTLLSSEQTIPRKLKEIILALWIERLYSKKEILQMYFNEAPYGGPTWGVKAASEMYFDKKASDLNLAQSAYLAGLPAAPTLFSPYGPYPEKGRERQQEVLRRMIEDGYISQKEADEALSFKLNFQPPKTEIYAPHFVMYVRSLLASKYGEKVVSQGGLKVITTLDLDIQEMAEEAVENQISKLKEFQVSNGAAMVTDPKTGQILAMVGSKDYFDPAGGNFNVTLSLRQPGSAIKVITYAAAFEAGFSPGTLLLDAPVTFPPPAGEPYGKPYSPTNYDSRFHGPISLRTALGSSYNVPAVKVLNLIGLPAMLQTARKMGITTFTDPKNYGLSLTLGGGGVKMLEMMTVYGTLSSGGIKYPSQAILTIEDSLGHLIENHQKSQGKRVLSDEIAYLLTHILSDNQARTPAFGPNSQLVIPGHTVAVKTGTSDNKRDNWVLGYTPDYVVGTWVGNNDNSPMNPKLASGITGATPIWHDIMANLLSDKPDVPFQKPTKI